MEPSLPPFAGHHTHFHLRGKGASSTQGIGNIEGSSGNQGIVGACSIQRIGDIERSRDAQGSKQHPRERENTDQAPTGDRGCRENAAPRGQGIEGLSGTKQSNQQKGVRSSQRGSNGIPGASGASGNQGIGYGGIKRQPGDRG